MTLFSHAERPAVLSRGWGATNFMRFAVNKHEPPTSGTWQASPPGDSEGSGGAKGGSARQPSLIEVVSVRFLLSFLAELLKRYPLNPGSEIVSKTNGDADKRNMSSINAATVIFTFTLTTAVGFKRAGQENISARLNCSQVK